MGAGDGLSKVAVARELKEGEAGLPVRQEDGEAPKKAAVREELPEEVGEPSGEREASGERVGATLEGEEEGVSHWGVGVPWGPEVGEDRSEEMVGVAVTLSVSCTTVGVGPAGVAVEKSPEEEEEEEGERVPRV